jgi:hypothetical protein
VAQERKTSLPHKDLRIDPRREGPFCQDLGMAIQDMMQDLQAEVGHPDLVAVRKGKGHLQASLRGVLMDRVVLPSQIAGRLTHVGKDFEIPGVDCIAPIMACPLKKKRRKWVSFPPATQSG